MQTTNVSLQAINHSLFSDPIEALSYWIGRIVIWIQEQIHAVLQKIAACLSFSLQNVNQLKKQFNVTEPAWLDNDLKRVIKLSPDLKRHIAPFLFYEILKSVDGNVAKFSPKFQETFKTIIPKITSIDTHLLVNRHSSRHHELLCKYQFAHLKTVDLSHEPLFSNDIRTVSACFPQITSLFINISQNHTQTALADIAEFVELKKLKVQINDYRYRGSLQALQPLQELEVLEIDDIINSWSVLSNATLQDLKLFPKLKSVTLSVGSHITKDGYKALGEHPTLEQVTLRLSYEHAFTGSVRRALEMARPNLKFVIQT
jgi:hypothetical protein